MNYKLFLSETPFFNLASLLLNFFMNWASNVALVLLNTYKYHFNETPFIFRLLDLSNPRPPTLKHGLRPPINLATRTFFLPETLHQLLSTNWIIVDSAVRSAMGLNKRKYLQNTVVRWGY